jgi:hypothetical protein
VLRLVKTVFKDHLEVKWEVYGLAKSMGEVLGGVDQTGTELELLWAAQAVGVEHVLANLLADVDLLIRVVCVLGWGSVGVELTFGFIGWE